MKLSKTDCIAILIGIILFGISIIPIIEKGQFVFETDYMVVAYGASTSIMISLIIIILTGIIELKDDFEKKREFPRDEEISSLLDMVISSFLKIRGSNDKVFNKRLGELITIFKIDFSDLKNGHIVLEDTESWQEYLLTLIKSLKEGDTYKATSLVHISGWWETDFGSKFLREHKSAIERGAKIIRIFYINEINPKENYVKEIKRQLDLGVDIKIIEKVDDLYPFQIEDFSIVEYMHSDSTDSCKYTTFLELNYNGIIKKMHVYNTNIEHDRKSQLFNDLEIHSKSPNEYIKK